MIYAKEINGTVKRVGLPTNYLIGNTRVNLKTMPKELQESEGFYECIVPEITEYQRLLEQYTFIDGKYTQIVEDFTQEEIDNSIEQQAEQTAYDVKRNKYTNAFNLAVRIETFVENKNLTTNQNNILTGLATKLFARDIQGAKSDFEAIPTPSGKMLKVYNKLVTEFDTI